MLVNKDKVLTVRWNNILMLLLGVPALAFIAFIFFTTFFTDRVGFFGVFTIGIIYCLIIEQHSAKTIAWQLRKTENHSFIKNRAKNRFIVIVYNFVWWIPVALPFTSMAGYRASAFIFFFITLARAFINLYRMNILPLEKAVRFPLRSPE